ncbi:SDR family NAD(P)-dependent oxidoreductase [Kineosporia sp. J2-2]|uniref:SDR family NAD(P)-dependent oxidoreductase n=1 Tax=Kineosporia corallincola TaxID=2835133 RepID=A0ABS5TGE9_9ACTN|nr:SDR family NAD(P)-dependent oxidoreductase [Kineosporia corallincola]MBT0770175.1 SDR family NAD(P)-dependent oxidoreductase [Kineosporia corallincola]
MPLAVVTGTSRGLGHALVTELHSHGWDVVAVQRGPDPECSELPRVRTARHDLRDRDSAPVLDAVAGRAVDALINNAMSGAPPSRLGEVDVDRFAHALDVNVTAPLRLTRDLLPSLLAAPDPVVVNVTSRLGSLTAQARGDFAGFGTSYAYRVSKAAQNMLTVCLAQELGDRVRCLAVHPGRLATATGRPGASTSPAVAAGGIRALLHRHDLPSPSFLDLETGRTLEW